MAYVTPNPPQTSQAAGALYASHVMLVDAAGNAVVFGSGGTSSVDGAAYGAGSTLGTPSMGVYTASPRTIADGKLAPMSLDATGAVIVSGASGGSAGTEYTEDAASAADPKGGMLMLRRRDTLNGSEVSADGDNIAASATAKGELCVNAAALPLPTGAATESTLSALNGDLGATTDAAASGNGSLIAIVKQNRLLLNGGLPAALAANGGLKIEGVASGVAVPVSGTFWQATQPVSGTVAVSTINSVAPAFNTGARGATVQRVTIATDDVVPAAQSGTWTVQPGNTANTTAWKVDGSAVTQPVSLATNTPAVATSGGWTPSRTVSAASDNATSVKGSAGQLGFVVVANVNAAMRYLHFYNKASAPTLGTDVPVLTIPIPGNTAGTGAVFSVWVGVAFTTGIAFACTTTTGGTPASGNTAANDITISLGYK